MSDAVKSDKDLADAAARAIVEQMARRLIEGAKK